MPRACLSNFVLSRLDQKGPHFVFTMNTGNSSGNNGSFVSQALYPYFACSVFLFAGQSHIKIMGERGGSVVERLTPEREVGVRNIPPPCCVLEEDTLLPESNGNTQ